MGIDDVRVHMGRYRRGGEEPEPGQDDPDRMLEDAADGCPGGDQRSFFVQSLLAFGYRRRDQQGNRVSNVMLERCGDELVLEAMAYFEAEESSCAAFCASELQRQIERRSGGGT